MKMTCTKKDYCPCSDCNDVFVQETVTKYGIHDWKQIKGTINDQCKKRTEFVPEEIKKEFYHHLDLGENLGKAREATNLGLMVAGQLVLQAVSTTSYYRNPYKQAV